MANQAEQSPDSIPPAAGSDDVPRVRHNTSMISWVDEREADAPDDLTWSDPEPTRAHRGAVDLGGFFAAADASSSFDALAFLGDACIRRWGCSAAVWALRSAVPGSERLVRVCLPGGQDDVALAAELSVLSEGDFSGALQATTPGSQITPIEVSVGGEGTCSLWLTWDASFPVVSRIEDDAVAAAGLALRAAMLSERLAGTASTTPVDLVRRDRREVAIGRLVSAASSSLVAAHASLAATHASIEAELAAMRAVAPLHPSARACVALVHEAEAASHSAWQVVSAVACLADDASRRCDPSQVLSSMAALLGPYLSRRATIEAQVTKLHTVRIAPAVLAETLAVLTTRVAQQFPEHPGTRVVLSGVETERGVELEVRGSSPQGTTANHQDHDAVVGEVYSRDFAARCGGYVEVLRDGVGATRFRVVMPRG